MEMGTVHASCTLGVSLIHSGERWHKEVLPTKISLCWRSELGRKLLCSTLSRLFVSPSLPRSPGRHRQALLRFATGCGCCCKCVIPCWSRLRRQHPLPVPNIAV